MTLCGLLLLTFLPAALSDQKVVVTSAVGQIQGTIDEESNTTCFYNIPFGKPPTGMNSDGFVFHCNPNICQPLVWNVSYSCKGQ